MDKTLIYQNKKIHYTILGEGNTIVLLHGFLESLRIWDEFAIDFSKNFRLVCIDLPGFGKSDVFAQSHPMDFMADVVKAVLDENSIKKCVMIGHSMGGYVTLAFAGKYPYFLKGISLFHSHASPDNEDTKRNRDRTIKIVDQGKKDFIHHFIPALFAPENIKRFQEEIIQLQEQAKHTSAEGIKAALMGMKERKSQLGTLCEIECPVQFILGKQDNRIPYDKGMAQAVLPKYANIVFLREAGHMGYLEEKQHCLINIQSFLANCFKQ